MRGKKKNNDKKWNINNDLLLLIGSLLFEIECPCI